MNEALKAVCFRGILHPTIFKYLYTVGFDSPHTLAGSLTFMLPMSFLCRAQTTMSCYVTNFESLLLKEFPPNDMTKPLNAIISAAYFSVNFPLQRKGSQLTRIRPLFLLSAVYQQYRVRTGIMKKALRQSHALAQRLF